MIISQITYQDLIKASQIGFDILIERNKICLTGSLGLNIACSLAKFIRENYLRIELTVIDENWHGKIRWLSGITYGAKRLNLFCDNSGGTHHGQGASFFESLESLIEGNEGKMYTDGWSTSDDCNEFQVNEKLGLTWFNT